ncbi:hypothetical protein FB451DRAFT_1193607 [Mycena latifolia]|nr:hypothetical protein FB451DRAFT_1193607 [Mycena latifolia]
MDLLAQLLLPHVPLPESYLTCSFEDGARAIPAKPKTAVNNLVPTSNAWFSQRIQTTAKFMNVNQHMLIGNRSSATMAQRLAWYRLMPSYRTTGMEVPNFDNPHTKSSLFILFTFPYAIMESPMSRAIMNLLEVQWYGNVVVVKKSGDHLEDCTPEDIMSAIECVGKLMDHLADCEGPIQLSRLLPTQKLMWKITIYARYSSSICPQLICHILKVIHPDEEDSPQAGSGV